MSLIIATAALYPAFHLNSSAQSPATSTVMSAATAPGAVRSPAAIAARAWVLLLDKQRWDASWNAAGTLFQTQMPKEKWATTIETVRQPLGPISSRTVQSATKASSLPGAPDGDYEIIAFRTDFANKHDAIETVVMAREGSAWKVDGYFIR